MFLVARHLKVQPLRCLLELDVKHFSRTLSGDRMLPLNENTLTGRFILYLANDKTQDVSNNEKNELVKTLKNDPKTIQTFGVKHVISALKALNNKEIIKTRTEFYQLLSIIDTECCYRVNKSTTKTTFNLLHAFIDVIPNRITQCHYFHVALKNLMIQNERLNKEELVQLIFFIGFLKKSREAQSMLRSCIKIINKEFINILTKEDLCIVCNSTFKTSTKIKNTFLLNKVRLYISDNLSLLRDPAVFITLIKTLRHNRYQDDDILATIACTMFFNKTIECYSFSAMCHILALYADYLYYNQTLLEVFSKRCLDQLVCTDYKEKSAYFQEQPRTKDIKRFLWALSNLNFNLCKEDIENVIMPQILLRKEAGEFANDPETLTDILLYLWMMQYRAKDLIKEVVTKETMDIVKGGSSLPSQRSLNLLLTCIYYEDPNLFSLLKVLPEKQINYNIDVQLIKRPVLKTVVDSLLDIGSQNDIEKFGVDCQVPCINIVGITGYQKKIYKIVHIEVLDDYTCLKNTENMPSGLMQLKLRLLDKCDEGLVVIEATDILDCSDSELKDILKEEVSMVC